MFADEEGLTDRCPGATRQNLQGTLDRGLLSGPLRSFGMCAIPLVAETLCAIGATDDDRFGDGPRGHLALAGYAGCDVARLSRGLMGCISERMVYIVLTCKRQHKRDRLRPSVTAIPPSL